MRPSRSAKKRGAGEGSIRQRPNGRWEGRIRIGGKRVSFFAATREEVQGKLRAEAGRKAAGHGASDRQITVGAYLERWIEGRRGDLRPATHVSYESAIRTHLVPDIGTVRLARLTPDDVTKTLARLGSRAVQPVRGGAKPRLKALSAQSIRNVHAILRSALNDAVRADLVARNVASVVRPPRVDREPVRAISPGEARAILDAVRGHRLEALYVLALASGARLAELLGLTWQNVDLEGGTVKIAATLRRVRGEWSWGVPKTRSSRRSVPIPAAAVQVLEAHRGRQVEEQRGEGKPTPLRPPAKHDDPWHELVFKSPTGGPVHPTVANATLTKLLTDAGIERMRFHDLRHGAAAIALASGVPMRLVMEMLGHSQMSMTADTYTSVTDELAREGSERIGRALFGEAAGLAR